MEAQLQRYQLVAATAAHEAGLATVNRELVRAQFLAAAQRCRQELADLDVALAACAERDARQAARPAGCTCLGLGGRGALVEIGETAVWAVACDCPEGQAATAAADQARAVAAAEAVAQAAAQAAAAEEAARRERLDYAHIPTRYRAYTFESFPLERAKLPVVQRLQAFGQRYPTPRSVFLTGAFGRGKTGLAVCALKAWLEAGGWGLFVTVPDWLDWVRAGYAREARGAQAAEAVMQRAATTPLLVLDDLGAERVTGWVRERLFRLINTRSAEERPTIFTSNYSLAELHARFAGEAPSIEDRTEAERLLWRIQEMADVLELHGRNLRAGAQEGEAC